MSETPDLIQRLIAIRDAFGWNDSQMARELGIDRATWWGIRTGRYHPSMDVLSAIVQRFPELAPQITLFLQWKVTDRNASVTEDNADVPTEASVA